MSDYCAVDWNSNCEYASANTNSSYPNMIQQCNKVNGACIGSGIGSAFTQGEMLIRNTASKKYLTQESTNCAIKYQPFDPLTPTSPMIRYFEPVCNMRGNCVPVYEVDPDKIDEDPVMNKILSNPIIAMDILLNIYNSAKRMGKLEGLRNTRLYNFFSSPVFQNYANSSKRYAELRAGN